MSTLNGCVIWGDGVNQIQEIVETIKDDKNFHVLRIQKKIVGGEVSDWEKIVKDVNSTDEAHGKKSISEDIHKRIHELEELKYILWNSPDKVTLPYCWFIVLKNRKSIEEIKNLEKVIKDKYHPTCIRTAYDETELLDYFKIFVDVCNCRGGLSIKSHKCGNPRIGNEFRTLEHYKRRFDHEYYIPFYCSERDVEEIQKVERQLHLLTCKPLGYKNSIKILESPHYKYLCGNKQPYIDYIQLRWDTGDIGRGHSVRQFEDLINNYDDNYKDPDGKKCPIIIWNKDNTEPNRIIDGVHRAAIIYFNNRDKFKLEWAAADQHQDIMRSWKKVTESIDVSCLLLG